MPDDEVEYKVCLPEGADYAVKCHEHFAVGVHMLGKTLMTRRLDRSRDSLRNDINYHLCLIQHSPRKKRSVHSSVLPSILPVTTHSALLSSMLLVFAFWL